MSRDGAKVYYLSGNTLWKLDIDSDSASLIHPGWFEAIALSPDGTKLALLGHGLLLVDIAGTTLQSVVPSESVGENPVDVQFSHDGSHIFYSRISGRGADYYCVALDGTGLQLVRTSCGSAESYLGHSGFALTRDDSILESSGDRDWPSFNPTDGDVMAYAESWWFNGDICLAMLSSDSVIALKCNPYSNSYTAYPSWFPDGRKIVFCATDNGMAGHYQLWMLDSVEF